MRETLWMTVASSSLLKSTKLKNLVVRVMFQLDLRVHWKVSYPIIYLRSLISCPVKIERTLNFQDQMDLSASTAKMTSKRAVVGVTVISVASSRILTNNFYVMSVIWHITHTAWTLHSPLSLMMKTGNCCCCCFSVKLTPAGPNN